MSEDKIERARRCLEAFDHLGQEQALDALAQLR